jgi:hypothetical protein
MRFSLSTLLLLITIFGVWLGFRTNRARSQRRAVAAIRQAGGIVIYDYEDKSPVLDPNWAERLVGPDFFHNVVYVDLLNSFTPDSLLREMASLLGGNNDDTLVGNAGNTCLMGDGEADLLLVEEEHAAVHSS